MLFRSPGGSSSPPSHPDSLHTYCPSLQLHESVCSLLPLGSLLGLHLPPFLLSLSIYLSIHLSTFLSFSLCTSLPLCLSINRSVYAANQYLHHETLVMALNTGVCEYIYDSYTRGKNIEYVHAMCLCVCVCLCICVSCQRRDKKAC